MVNPRDPISVIKRMPVAVPPCYLSISLWRATGTPFKQIYIVLKESQSGPVYYFCLEKAFLRKGEARTTSLPPAQQFLCHLSPPF